MGQKIRYDRLPTEQEHPGKSNLEKLSTPALLRLMNDEDANVVSSLRRQLSKISAAIKLITQSLSCGGRLFFLGAGTSGRLGVMEAAECPPTFNTDPSMVQAIIAGGPDAVFKSREGAEDDRKSAKKIIRSRVRRGDAVVGITASGVTPFVDEALAWATRRNAYTVLLTCNPKSPIPARVRIALSVGPEILTGSTRLKAGTATKLALNMITVGAMVQLGKTHGNLMLDVRPTSRKLRARALRIIQALTGDSEKTARYYLKRARGRVRIAVLMAAGRISAAEAKQYLARPSRPLST